MLAGLVVISAAFGMVAVAASVMLSLPTWMALLAFPGVSSLTLLMTAALVTLRSETARDRSLHQLGHQPDSSIG